VLLVVDCAQGPAADDWTIAGLVGERPAVLVINKSDLPAAPGMEGLLPGRQSVRVSALTGQGIEDLEQAVLDTALAGHVQADEMPLVSRPRQADALRRALESVRSGLAALQQGWPDDCISIDVTDAVAALGEITGETVTDDLLARIFADFCIGK